MSEPMSTDPRRPLRALAWTVAAYGTLVVGSGALNTTFIARSVGGAYTEPGEIPGMLMRILPSLAWLVYGALIVCAGLVVQRDSRARQHGTPAIALLAAGQAIDLLWLVEDWGGALVIGALGPFVGLLGNASMLLDVAGLCLMIAVLLRLRGLDPALRPPAAVLAPLLYSLCVVRPIFGMIANAVLRTSAPVVWASYGIRSALHLAFYGLLAWTAWQAAAAPAVEGAAAEGASPARAVSPAADDAIKDLLIGGLWAGGGLLVTLGSYLLADELDNRFMVAWGAVLYGALRAGRGMIRML